MPYRGPRAQAASRGHRAMLTRSFLSLGCAELIEIETADGAILPVYALGGPAGAPGLLFGHANGLAAGSYEPWLRELAGTARVFAFDARGHGGARWPEGPLEQIFHVDRFADDLAAIAGGVAQRLAAAPLRLAARGQALPWSGAILLFEPPIFPPREAPFSAEALEKQATLIARSAGRRADWSDPDALCRILRSRGMFARFRADLLAAHCRATLRPLPQGGYTLCCPPAVESAIFRNHRVADTWTRLGAASVPLHLVSGDPDRPERDWVSVAMPAMAAALPAARLTVLAGTGHMMIFEQPDACRDLVLAMLR